MLDDADADVSYGWKRQNRCKYMLLLHRRSATSGQQQVVMTHVCTAFRHCPHLVRRPTPSPPLAVPLAKA